MGGGVLAVGEGGDPARPVADPGRAVLHVHRLDAQVGDGGLDLVALLILARGLLIEAGEALVPKPGAAVPPGTPEQSAAGLHVFPGLIDAHVHFVVETSPPQWDEASSTFKLAPNPTFVDDVGKRLARKALTRDDTVIVLCQGGVRAARAANAHDFISQFKNGYDSRVGERGCVSAPRNTRPRGADATPLALL